MEIKEFSSGITQVVGMQMAYQNLHLCNSYLPLAYLLFCFFSMLHHFSLSLGRFNSALLHIDMFMQYMNCVIYVGPYTPLGILFSSLEAIVLSLDLHNIRQKRLAYILNAAMIGMSSMDNMKILYIWMKVGIMFAIGVYYDNSFTGAIYHLVAHKAALEMWKTC